MKKLSTTDKFLVFLNSLFAALLLISYLSYYISPESVAFFSFISLSVPFLLIINFVFGIFWLLQFKRPFLISAIALLFGFNFIARFYSFSEKKVLLTDDIKVMSYNVRMFNLYNWIDNENTASDIYSFIKER